MQKIKVDYDKRFDTLYVSLADKSSSYGDDSSDDIIIMRDLQTDIITGFTVLSFFRKYKSHALPQLPPGINCSFERDIIPKIKQ